MSELERAHELLTLARTAIVLSASKDTGDPDHDWTTCEQPSCSMARSVVAEIDEFFKEH